MGKNERRGGGGKRKKGKEGESPTMPNDVPRSSHEGELETDVHISGAGN